MSYTVEYWVTARRIWRPTRFLFSTEPAAREWALTVKRKTRVVPAAGRDEMGKTLREGPFRAEESETGRIRIRPSFVTPDGPDGSLSLRTSDLPSLSRLLEKVAGAEGPSKCRRAMSCDGSGWMLTDGYGNADKSAGFTAPCPGCRHCKPAQPIKGKRRRSGGGR